MATVIIPWSQATVYFPPQVHVSACKTVTHMYLVSTSHGMQSFPLNYKTGSPADAVHEFCVAQKTNNLLDYTKAVITDFSNS